MNECNEFGILEEKGEWIPQSFIKISIIYPSRAC